jgi:enoyl-CoA hydratase/carnithine racemase
MTTDYTKLFKTADVAIDDDGVLTIRLHSRGGPLGWNALPHRELPELFASVAADRDVRVVVLTGTGDRFIDLIPEFEVGIAKGAASAAVMAELALLSDIVLCTEATYFQDAAHVPSGLVPGDGVQVLWPLLLGFNRGRYFLLTGEKIPAAEAHRLGLVSEVLPADALMDRALAHARRLAVCNPVFVRNTRLAFLSQLRRAMAADLSAGLALESLASLSGAQWTGPFAPEPIDATV